MSLFVAMVTASSSELRVSQFITCNDTLLVETYQLTRCRNRKKEAKKIAQHAYYCPVGTSETLMAKYDQIYNFEEDTPCHPVLVGLFWKNQSDFEVKKAKNFICVKHTFHNDNCIVQRTRRLYWMEKKLLVSYLTTRLWHKSRAFFQDINNVGFQVPSMPRRYVEETARLPCWLPRDQQVSHQKWISGNM